LAGWGWPPTGQRRARRIARRFLWGKLAYLVSARYLSHRISDYCPIAARITS
jgi:hypothetical protein